MRERIAPSLSKTRSVPPDSSLTKIKLRDSVTKVVEKINGNVSSVCDVL